MQRKLLLLLMLSGLLLALLSLTSLLSLPASIGLAAAWIAFPFLGLWADGAPASAYRSLLYGPFYLVWRLWIGMQARTRGKRVRWIRTRRSEEIASTSSKG